MLFKLAWKNVWRNGKRSTILFIAITIGLWCGLLASAIFFGMWETTINSAIDRELSHIQIHDPAFRDESKITNSLADPEKLVEAINSEVDISHFTLRTIIEGMASSPTSASGVKIVGINPEDEKKVTSIYKYVKEGEYLSGEKTGSVMIGRKLAEQLNLDLGNKLVLSFQSLDGTLIYSAFRIRGIYETESTMFNAINIFINKEDLFELLGSGPVYHEAAIKLNKSQDLPAVLNSLNNKLPGYAVEDWGKIAPEFRLTNETMTISLNIFLGLILFGLFFGITNTMLMSVIDRVREIGILMALGMKRYRIFSMIMVETVLLSLSGGITGMILGSISIGLLKNSGINLASFSDGLGIYGISSMLYPELPVSYYPVLTIMIIGTAMFGAVYPSLKAIRLNAASAIRTY